MSRRSSFLARVAACAALFVALLATEASAQTLSWAQQSPYTRDNQQDVTIGGDAINLADCKVDDVGDSYQFRFAPSQDVTGTNNIIHAWLALNSMTDCTQPGNQDAAQNVCRQVAAPVLYGSNLFVKVFVRDIVRSSWGAFSTPAGEEACDSGANPGTGVLQFFIVTTANTAGPALTYPVKFDLVGPDPPTNVKAGIGEDALVVKWKEPASTSDAVTYNVYAVPVDAPGDAGMGAAGAPSDDAGTPTTCTSNVLVPGELPPEGLKESGSSNGSTLQAEADGLTNGVRYAVAVSSVDAYLNPGKLSALSCGTPEPVTGFFEAYRAAGGGGGGGYCSIGAARSRTAAVGVVLAALGLMLRRVRRAGRAKLRGTA